MLLLDHDSELGVEFTDLSQGEVRLAQWARIVDAAPVLDARRVEIVPDVAGQHRDHRI